MVSDYKKYVGCRVKALGLRAQGLGFRAQDLPESLQKVRPVASFGTVVLIKETLQHRKSPTLSLNL